MLLITARVTSIPLFKPGDRFRRGHDRLVGRRRIGGAGTLAVNKETGGHEQECNECFCHKFLSFTFGMIRSSRKLPANVKITVMQCPAHMGLWTVLIQWVEVAVENQSENTRQD